MQIKKFNAADINEALRLVKAEFGGEAVILSTRSIKGKGVEVTAAADRETGSGYGAGAYAHAALPDLKKASPSTKTIEPWNPRNLTKPETTQTRNSKIETRNAPPAPDLHRELKELKDLMGSLVSHVQQDEFFKENKRLSEVQNKLVSTGIDETLSYKMLQRLCEKLTSKEMEDMPGILGRLKQFIMRQVTVAEIVENGHRPKVAIFVGPTGVGKTTTIAKLAAINAIKGKKKVALVTLDTYRIAAVEQLKVYARIIGIPVHVAGSPGDFAKTVAGIKGVDLVLVDTAGRGQRDRMHMGELSQIYKSGIPVETHLVISATAKEKDTMDIIRLYKGVKVDRLLFTKLDETSTYGGIFNALIASGKPVSYLTTGQSVPEDIEAATSERLADLILSGMRAEG